MKREDVFDEFIRRAKIEVLELILKMGPSVTFAELEEAWNKKNPATSMFIENKD